MLMQSWLSGLISGTRRRARRSLRRRRRPERLGAPAEVLEVRTLLSGTVTAALSLGTLTITGDANGNGVTLQNAGGVNHLQTDGSTTLIFNGVNMGTSADVAGLGFLNLKMDMSDGNDSVHLGNAGAGLAVAGSLNVALGAGQDTLNMQNVSVGLGTTITGSGAGQDAVTIAGSTLHGTTISTGNGTANVGISDSTFMGNLAITTGAAYDFVNFSGNIAVADGLARYSVTINTGDGKDEIKIDPLVTSGQHFTWVSGDVNIDAGDGGAFAGPAAQKIQIGDTLDGYPNPCSFAWQSGAVNIKSGSGVDVVGIGSNVEGGSFTWKSGNVSIDTGAGDDTVNVASRVFSKTIDVPSTTVSWNSGAVSINTGDGNDQVNIAGNLTASGAAAGPTTTASLNWNSGGIAINLGNGDDTLDLGEAEADAVSGGSSVCTFNMNAPSVSINTGDGSDSVTMLDAETGAPTSGASAVASSHLSAGFLSITAGNGTDSVTIATTELLQGGGSATSQLTAPVTMISLGNGSQLLRIGGRTPASGFVPAIGTMIIDGSISVNGTLKTGTQAVGVLGDGTISGNLSLNLGGASVAIAPASFAGLTIGGFTSISTAGPELGPVFLNNTRFVGPVAVSAAQPGMLNINGSEFDSLFQAFMNGGTINLARNLSYGPTEFKGPAYFFVGAGGVVNASHPSHGSPLIFDSLFEVVGGIPLATLNIFGPVSVNPFLEFLILTNEVVDQT